MTEQEALALMVAPGTPRPRKYRDGVIQVHLTRACDQACFGCTQGSQLAGKATFLTPGQFEVAVASLGFRAGDGRRPAFGWGNAEGRYPGVVGVFGGNPALSPHFEACCLLLQEYVPFAQRGLWCNHPAGKGKAMAATFDPAVCNLNCHLDRGAYEEFKRDWPASRPFGHDKDSRHGPCYVAMKDVLRKSCNKCAGGVVPTDRDDNECKVCRGTGYVYDEGMAWDLISRCDINQHWSAGIALFRGQLRAWFCEIAMAQSILHQDEPDYPDTGMPVDPETTGPIVHDGRVYDYWWQLPMTAFAAQVRKHCHECSVPLKGYGELAGAGERHGVEQVSATHAAVFRPKRPGRTVQVVTRLEQLGVGRLARATDYLGNAKR